MTHTFILVRDIKRLKSGEMKFMRRTARYSLWDPRRNEDILEELNIYPVKNKLAQYMNRLFFYILSAGRKTLDTQNNSLNVYVSK